jgi:hypothetical protein
MAAPRKPSMYDKINNLISDDLYRDMEKIKRELEETRRELHESSKEMMKDSERMRLDLRDQIAQQRRNQTQGYNPTASTYQQQIRFDPLTVSSKYNDDYYTSITMAKKAAGKSKTIVPKSNKIVDRRVTNNDISTYTPDTHMVKVSTKITHQDRENGTKKMIGMETVDWWEYVLIYGFFKATKIAYEFNIVKDMVKNPQHVVSLINKGAVVLTFVPKKGHDERSIEYDPKLGMNVDVLTGTLYREFQLPIEIPYKTGTKTVETKDGYFLYEETYETIEPDYEALGKRIASELEEKKINEGFKQLIANEIENGRISRV